jgi:hypothetical protein
MRTVAVQSAALVDMVAVGAVTAYGQVNTRSQDGRTAAVLDDNGNLGVPATR